MFRSSWLRALTGPSTPPQPSTPLSERWVLLVGNSRGEIALATVSVVRLGASEYRVWITTTFSTDQKVHEVLDYRYRSWRTLVDFRCGERLQRLHKIVFLDAGRGEVFTSEFSDSEGYESIDPETVPELEYLAVCRHLVRTDAHLSLNQLHQLVAYPQALKE